MPIEALARPGGQGELPQELIDDLVDQLVDFHEQIALLFGFYPQAGSRQLGVDISTSLA